MIAVTIYVDPQKQYRKLRMTGHAGNADNPVEGQELVCAAVSALTLNMANSVEHFTEDVFEAEEDGQGGGFYFNFPGEISEGSRLLINSLVFGLLDIEEAYGEPYIKIRFEEV